MNSFRPWSQRVPLHSKEFIEGLVKMLIREYKYEHPNEFYSYTEHWLKRWIEARATSVPPLSTDEVFERFVVSHVNDIIHDESDAGSVFASTAHVLLDEINIDFKAWKLVNDEYGRGEKEFGWDLSHL